MKLNNAQVLSVETKPGKNAYAGRNFYTVLVKSEIGDDLRLDWGSKAPPSVGVTVDCEVEDVAKYGKYRVLASTVGGATMNGSSVSLPSAPRGAAFPVPQDSREISIIRQSALKAATDHIMTHPHVFFNGWDGGYDESKMPSEDDYIKKVIELAFYFSEFSSGKLEIDIKSSLADKMRS